LAVLGSLALPSSASARDLLLIYGGYSDDNAFRRTIDQAYEDYATDHVVRVVGGEELERRYDDLVLVVGDAELLRECAGGDPPDLKLLEEELDRLRQDIDYEGQLFAYDIAIEELACAGERLSGADAATLYVQRGLVSHKLGDTDAAREDFYAALLIEPQLEWDKRHSPKARDDFRDMQIKAADAHTHSLYVADDGPSGTGIRIDGRSARAGEAERIASGDHLLSWRGTGEGDSGLLKVWGSVTVVGAEGLFDFLFRKPRDQAEEELREYLLDELAYREDVDEVILLDPVIPSGSLARGGRYSSPARTGLGSGYARTSHFNYGIASLDLWLRIKSLVHLELRGEFDITTGKPTGVSDDETAEPVADDEEATEYSDVYVSPSFQIGAGVRETHGIVQPGGGIGIRLYFTGPSLIVLTSMIFHGGVDIRAWNAPVVIRAGLAGGFFLGGGNNDQLGRDLTGPGRGIFNANIGVGFIL
jgi:hypothetical protein